MHWPAIIYFGCFYKTQVSFLGHCWKQEKKPQNLNRSVVSRWPEKPQGCFTPHSCRLFLPVHDLPHLGCLCLLQSLAGCLTPGASLALREPHGRAGVCPGQLSSSRLSSWTSKNTCCSVKSCMSGPHLTCDSASAEVLERDWSLFIF